MSMGRVYMARLLSWVRNMGRRVHSDETRAACMAALLTGQSISSVAREYKIPKGTVGDWSKHIRHSADLVGTIPTQKRPIGEQLMGYLHAALDTLTKQAVVFGDTNWLKKQPANELAILHGVLADKTIRLLEALSASAETTPEANDADLGAQRRSAD